MFEYAVLRVVPRVERGEALNAGVLVYCRQRDYLGSRVHLDVDRLRALDPTADAAAIGRALQAAADVCAAVAGGRCGRPGGAGVAVPLADRAAQHRRPAGAGAHRAHRRPRRRGRPAAAPAGPPRRPLTRFSAKSTGSSVGCGAGVDRRHGDLRRGRERRRPAPRRRVLRAARLRLPPTEEGDQHLEAPVGPVRLMIDDAALLEQLHGEVPRPGTASSFALRYGSPAEVDEVAARVAAAGHAVVTPPWDAPWGAAVRHRGRPGRLPGRPVLPAARLAEQGVDPAGELQVQLGDPAGGVADQRQVQRAPAQVDVGVVVHLLGDVGDRRRSRRRRRGRSAARRCGAGRRRPRTTAAASAARRRARRGTGAAGGAHRAPSAPSRLALRARVGDGVLRQVWMPHSVLPRPAQRPARGSSPGCDRAGARRAADRAVAELEQRVDRHLVLGDVGVDVVLGPGGDRVDLDHAALGVPVDQPACRPGSATRRGARPSPRRRSRPAPAASGCTLRSAAAQVGVALVQPRAVARRPARRRSAAAVTLTQRDRQRRRRSSRGCRSSRRSGSRCRGRPRRRRDGRAARCAQHRVGHRRGDREAGRRRCPRPSAAPRAACSTGSAMPSNRASAVVGELGRGPVAAAVVIRCTPVAIRRTVKARRQAPQRQPSVRLPVRASAPRPRSTGSGTRQLPGSSGAARSLTAASSPRRGRRRRRSARRARAGRGSRAAPARRSRRVSALVTLWPRNLRPKAASTPRWPPRCTWKPSTISPSSSRDHRALEADVGDLEPGAGVRAAVDVDRDRLVEVGQPLLQLRVEVLARAAWSRRSPACRTRCRCRPSCRGGTALGRTSRSSSASAATSVLDLARRARRG